MTNIIAISDNYKQFGHLTKNISRKLFILYFLPLSPTIAINSAIIIQI